MTAELPRDRDAKGLVAAILEQSKYLMPDDDWTHLLHKLTTIQDNATRLKVVLDEQDAAREGLVTALEVQALIPCKNRTPQACLRKPGLEKQHWCATCRAEAALARVKGGK